jgi:hypothetical protein
MNWEDVRHLLRRPVAYFFTFNAVSNKADEHGKTMRLGDALAAVRSEFPTTVLQGRCCVDFEQLCDCPQWKFGHVFCWMIG